MGSWYILIAIYIFLFHSTESHEPVAYVTALASVLGALALILFIAIVILILRRRKLHKNKNNTWILLATREHNVQEGHQKQQIPQAEMWTGDERYIKSY